MDNVQRRTCYRRLSQKLLDTENYRPINFLVYNANRKLIKCPRDFVLLTIMLNTPTPPLHFRTNSCTFIKLSVDTMPLQITSHLYFYNFVPSIIPSWWQCELLKWKRH